MAQTINGLIKSTLGRCGIFHNFFSIFPVLNSVTSVEAWWLRDILFNYHECTENTWMALGQFNATQFIAGLLIAVNALFISRKWGWTRLFGSFGDRGVVRLVLYLLGGVGVQWGGLLGSRYLWLKNVRNKGKVSQGITLVR